MNGRVLARLVSLTVALGASAVLLIFPFALGNRITPWTHAALPLLMLGISAAFVHGVGFRPDNRWLRVLFSPLCAWPLIAVGVALVAVV